MAFLIQQFNRQLYDGPLSGVRFDEQRNVSRCGVPPDTRFEVGQEQVFGEVLRQIGRDAMDIHASDIYDPASTNGLPGHGDPILSNIPVHENMEVSIAGLLQFENRNESDMESTMSPERGSEFIPTLPNIRDRLLGRTNRRIKRQCQHTAQIFFLRNTDDGMPEPFGLLGPTARAGPPLTPQPSITPVFLLALLYTPAQRPAATKAVAIMLL